ncbi:hypothetical protein AC579_2034 [Pseudocercospora musae]|uniref:F-box domain-containing protein n=1 Tax=Pseudocercospora musae TaxID=113226 RepID=A0A139IQX8_9PEZI|nr:hypothetical protein AC579_2034 [Pseudocercospora musae]
MLSNIRQYLTWRQRATTPAVVKHYMIPPEATIEDLPTEMLAEVMVHYSPVPTDYRTLALVSKKFNAVATPFLYSQFSNLTSSTRIMAWPPSIVTCGLCSCIECQALLLAVIERERLTEKADEVRSPTNIAHLTRLRLLLRTITQQPGLAAHFRQLNIRLWVGAANDLPSTEEIIGYLEAILPYAAYRDVHYPMSTSLRNAVYDAQVMLLLLFAKNTRMLHFSLPSVQEIEEFGRINANWTNIGSILPLFLGLVRNQQVPSILPELKSVQIENRFESKVSNGIVLGVTAPSLFVQTFMLLPKTDNIRADTICSRPFVQDTRRIHGTSSVTRLHLSQSYLDIPSLSDLVSTCASLQDLAVEWHETEAVPANQDEADMDLRQLWESLQRHCSSLQHLKLVFRAEAVKCITHRPAFRSLAEFPALESLCIDDYALAGALQGEYVDEWEVDDLFTQRTSFLPPNLKTLVFHTRKELIDSFSIMAQIHHMLPESLEHLTVTFADMSLSPNIDLEYTAKPEMPNLMRTTSKRGICYSPHNSWIVECWKAGDQSIKQGLVEYDMLLHDIDGIPMKEEEDEEEGVTVEN